MPTALEGGEHERGTPLSLGGGARGSPPRKFRVFSASMCVYNCCFFFRFGPDFSHDFLLEKIFLGA